jgi:hypothetical protein
MHIVDLQVDDMLDLPVGQVAGSGRRRGASGGSRGSGGAARDQADDEGAPGQCGDRLARPPVTE